ncbi:Hypothetical predicted protein [Olea europaea subsp. europaea]|uniref:Uncharacterized protein n=1 Tax=Olea europaea subsp. europaea TaxID=158383 RepID=A0A8S0QIE3_OLEEU|nr:Hypothetical predicted protein [Olea europaea subsp. europaea]
MSDAKMKNEKDVRNTIHEFSIAMQIWAFEAVPELDERFDERFGTVPDRPVQFLDNFARSVVGPQFHEVTLASGGHEGSGAGDDQDDEFGAGLEDDETSASDDRQTPEGNDDDGSKADDSRDSGGDTSSETGGGDTEDEDDASGRQSGGPSTSGLQDGEGGDEQSPQDDDRAEEGDMQEMNGATVETITHIPYDVVNDLKGGYEITSIPYWDMVKWNGH